MSTIAEYILHFCILVIQLSKQKQILLVDKFIHELKPKIYIELEFKDSRTLDEVFRLIDCYDIIVYRRNFNVESDNYNKSIHESSYEEDDESMQIDALRVKSKYLKSKQSSIKCSENQRLQKSSHSTNIINSKALTHATNVIK